MGKKKANNYSKFISFLLYLFELTSLYINNLNAPSFFFLVDDLVLVNQSNKSQRNFRGHSSNNIISSIIYTHIHKSSNDF